MELRWICTGPHWHYDVAGLLLHEASFTGRADVVHLLLQHNADVNERNISNETQLHYASMWGQTRAVSTVTACQWNMSVEVIT